MEKNSWIQEISKVPKLVITCSEPISVTHKYHVEDREKGFIGLPKEWADKLKKNGITEYDYCKDKETVIQVLDFEERQIKEKESFSATMPEKLVIPSKEELISKEDPTFKFLIECKIGQGAFGEVYIAKERQTEKRV